MKLLRATTVVEDHIVVMSYPGDPDLVFLLTNTEWTLDAREGGLHGLEGKELRRYWLLRTHPSVHSKPLIAELKASLAAERAARKARKGGAVSVKVEAR